jgi:hypothetical protein
MTISTARSRVPHRLVRTAVVALACAAPSLAFAQSAPQGGGATNPNCPPGSWFCADTQEKPAAPAGQPVQPAPADKAQPLQPLPPDQPAKQPPVRYAPAPQPPVVIYQPPPPVIIREAPQPYYYTPREAPLRRREWGLNLHLEGAMLGSKSNHDSGMGGAGFGLRYKPSPYFGLEADVDFVGGRDYNGFRRGETAFTINGLIFVNPRSKTQVYFLAGFGWAGASVSDDRHTYDSSTTYKYFGGQLGVGLEFRLAKHFALNVDLRGFVRGRTDDNAQYQPEFVDNSGRTTNTSGGGLITGGGTFYF